MHCLLMALLPRLRSALRSRRDLVVENIGIRWTCSAEEVIAAARSPWQNAFAERLVGSLRRECLDHIVVLGEIHLLRILTGYFEYHNQAR